MKNMQSPEYRSLMYDDIVESVLKGGASLDLAQNLLYILRTYFKEDTTDEQIENEVWGIHGSLLEGGEYKSRRNIQQEVDNAVTFRGKGQILLTDLYTDLKLTEPADKASCRTAINRLVARGILEKIDTGRTGTYRLLDKAVDETVFLTQPKGEFKIHLPFELHTMCKIFPKNIIVLAGTKSSGKTAVCLNIALENQNKHNVVYMNSEMGDEEYTERMTKLGCNKPEDIKFQCIHKSSNYHDLINGNETIYIIDFLEIHDKFYEIGKQIKQIHDKLKDGIAIIAIQMKGTLNPNSGERLGRGGDFSKEVARLYLSLDYDQAMRCTRVGIEEMKSPKTTAGYRGWYRNIKVVDGSRLSPMGSWTNIR